MPLPGAFTRAGQGAHAQPPRAKGAGGCHASQPQGRFFASSSGITGSFTQDISPPWPAGERLSFLTPLTLYRYGGQLSCPQATGCTRLLAGSQRVWESITGGMSTAFNVDGLYEKYMTQQALQRMGT